MSSYTEPKPGEYPMFAIIIGIIIISENLKKETGKRNRITASVRDHTTCADD